jgi:hypothetical protein
MLAIPLIVVIFLIKEAWEHDCASKTKVVS